MSNMIDLTGDSRPGSPVKGSLPVVRDVRSSAPIPFVRPDPGRSEEKRPPPCQGPPPDLGQGDEEEAHSRDLVQRQFGSNICNSYRWLRNGEPLRALTCLSLDVSVLSPTPPPAGTQDLDIGGGVYDRYKKPSQAWLIVALAFGWARQLPIPLANYYQRMGSSRCPAWLHGCVGAAIEASMSCLLEVPYDAERATRSAGVFNRHAGRAQSCWKVYVWAIDAAVHEILCDASAARARSIARLACAIVVDIIASIPHWELEFFKWSVLHGGFVGGCFVYCLVRPMVARLVMYEHDELRRRHAQHCTRCRAPPRACTRVRTGSSFTAPARGATPG